MAEIILAVIAGCLLRVKQIVRIRTIEHDANKEKIWSLSNMDADHVAAWSKGG